jgi:ring-1,2-phenylacetyl-CoA epoxidase subunit PaaD
VVSPVSTAAVDEATVRRALADVVDPEIPTISIVDLGIVDRIDISTETVRVDLLPTFVGCPALDVIRAAVEDRLAEFGRPTSVRFIFEHSWTTDRLTAAGRQGLRRAGIAPPGSAVSCPFCDSTEIAMDNLFGPTLCRSLYYCRSCRQPFEAFKPI